MGGILVHEASHFKANGGTKDYVYGMEKCKRMARNNPDNAVNNADNYEYFAQNAPDNGEFI